MEYELQSYLQAKLHYKDTKQKLIKMDSWSNLTNVKLI